MSKPLLSFAALATGLLLAGCSSLPQSDGALHGPFFKPTVFQAAQQIPADMRRVVLLPIANAGVQAEEVLYPLETARNKALNLAARFEVISLSREDCARLTGTRSVLSVDMLPHDFFQKLAANYGADGVLFFDLTQYSAYSPQTIGARAKLYRLSDRSLVWAIDQTFSASNPAVVNSLRNFWLKSEPPGTPVDMSGTALDSPSKFAEYVMSASFGTLPPRK